MKNLFVLLIAGFFLQSAHASVVEFKGTPKAVNVSGKTVNVYPEVVLSSGDTKQTLKLSGYGLRQKTIAFLNFNVYLAASYVDAPEAFQSNAPLQALKGAKGRVIILNMLRGMTSEEVRTAFEEALDKNQVDLNDKAVASVFAQFEGNLVPGDKILLASYPTTGSTEALTVELPKKVINEQGNLLGLDFWKIWFGEPVDEKMGELKNALVGKAE